MGRTCRCGRPCAPGRKKCQRCAEQSQAATKRWRQRLKEQGIPRSDRAAPDTIRQAQKRLRDKRKALGLCVRCGSPSRRGAGHVCDVCAKKDRERERLRREAARAAGLCIACKKLPTAQGHTMCEGCMARRRERNAPGRDAPLLDR